jgi:hypothetical protein
VVAAGSAWLVDEPFAPQLAQVIGRLADAVTAGLGRLGQEVRELGPPRAGVNRAVSDEPVGPKALRCWRTPLGVILRAAAISLARASPRFLRAGTTSRVETLRPAREGSAALNMFTSIEAWPGLET